MAISKRRILGRPFLFEICFAGAIASKSKGRSRPLFYRVFGNAILVNDLPV
jgi:hypothetical protein